MLQNLNRSFTKNNLSEFGAKPSISEDRGISLLTDDDLLVFSPGISTGGIAEIRMALTNAKRKIIAVTIDNNGLEYVQGLINALGLQKQIKAKLEDLRGSFSYPNSSFDFIYSRLSLHYLSAADLNHTLKNFNNILKTNGRLFVVVRSVKNLDGKKILSFDENTKFTKVQYLNDAGTDLGWEERYFHTPESITNHLANNGFSIISLSEYQEQIYIDFKRERISSKPDHLIEVLAKK